MSMRVTVTSFAWIALICALGVAPAEAQQQSLQVDAHTQDGVKHSAIFFGLRDGSIDLALDGGVRRLYSSTEIPLLVFDDRYTNLDADRKAVERAYPHTIVFKDGRVLQGTALNYYPGGAFLALVDGRRETYNAVDVARIYFDPKRFFAEQQAADQPPRLRRGEAFLRLSDGRTLIAEIEDIRGGQDRYYALAGGKHIPMDDVVYINFETADDLTRSDRDQLKRGQATFFLRGGRVIYGTVRDMLGDQMFELQDGQKIQLRDISRVYFR